MVGDSNLHVKDATAWALGIICDLLSIKLDFHPHPIISALVVGLNDSPPLPGPSECPC